VVREGKAYQYALWCTQDGNRKVGRYIKKQAKAWLEIADGESGRAYVDEKQFEKISKILKLIVHPDLGCSMYDGLEDYAWLLITAVLCTKARRNDKRYYHTALLEIARKNFKTFNSAVIFILLMLIEPEFSRFFSVAPDLKLSSELKQAIRKIIKKSPALVEEFKILRSEIRCKITDSEYTPLAYSQDRMDGKLANAFLADEAGALDAYPVEAMRSSQITLEESLGIIISTQYPNDLNVFMDEIDIAKNTLDGLENGIEGYFALLYEPDEELLKDEGWKTDDRIIYQANPAAVKNENIFKNIRDKRTLATIYDNKKENFLCKHLNIRYKGLGTEGYIDSDKVKRCKIEENPDFWQGRRVWLGLDLSQTDDNTSVAMVAEDDTKLYFKVWGFIPGDKVEEKTLREKVDYAEMIRRGVCFAVGEEVIDYRQVEQFIMDIPEKYGVEIVQVGYDRYNAISTVQKLEAEGIECVEIKQHSSVLHPATKLLKEKILSQEAFYEENALLEINFANARCTKDTNLNVYVNKKRSVGKVDMVVSTINAVHLVQQEILFGDDEFTIQVL
jgi:phage terminase large subunit-like protein